MRSGKTTNGGGRGKILRPWRQRTLLSAARIIVAVYLIVIVVFTIFQTELIFPGASSQGTADAAVDPPPGCELLRLKGGDGTPVAALFGKSLPTEKQTAPTVIYFYGNAMCVKDALGEFQQFRRLGANVLAVEYEGYGMSGGSAGETGCYAAAETGYEYLLTRPDIDRSRIVPAGWSLGAAVAIDLAARHAAQGHIAGVMTFSAFTSMAAVASFHYPFLPVSMLLRHHFNSLEKIARLNVPLLMGHGRRDNIVPFRMADRLAAAAKSAGLQVARFTVEDAGHNDLFANGEETINQAAGEFLRQLPPAPPALPHGSPQTKI